MDKRVLVTGRAGFLGSSLADVLLAYGYQVRVLDVLFPQVHGRTQERPPYLHPEIEFVYADITEVEDYAIARLDLATGATVSLTCSWRLSAGCNAMISAAFYDTRGGLALRNVAGSFYDFTPERFWGTRRQSLHEPPDIWGGRAAVAWARQLVAHPQFHPDIAHVVTVAEVLDAIYGR